MRGCRLLVGGLVAAALGALAPVALAGAAAVGDAEVVYHASSAADLAYGSASAQAIPGTLVTIAASASPQLVLVDVALYFTKSNGLYVGIAVDGTERVGYGLRSVADGNDWNTAAASWPFTIGGDGATHTIQVVYAPRGDTSALTFHERSLTARVPYTMAAPTAAPSASPSAAPSSSPSPVAGGVSDVRLVGFSGEGSAAVAGWNTSLQVAVLMLSLVVGVYIVRSVLR